MSKTLSLVLLVVGVLFLAFVGIAFLTKSSSLFFFQHQTIILGVIGLILAAVGAFGTFGGKRA